MGIINFKNFHLNEKRGVADATLFYIDPIFEKVWNELLEFMQSDDSLIEEDFPIAYNTLRPHITDKITYALFPVVGIDVNIHFKKMTEKEFGKKYKYVIERRNKVGKSTPYRIGGFATNFGHRNWSGYSRLADPIKKVADHGIILNIGVSLDIAPIFNINTFKKVIQDEIEETIWHELNHLYEYYQRVLSSTGKITSRGPSAALTAADVNAWGIPKEIYDFWVFQFTYFLYASEPQELNAQVQEAAFWVSKYGFDSIYKADVWRTLKNMEDFSADEVIKGLDNKIAEYIASKDPQVTALRPGGVLSYPIKERLKNMWVQQYEKSLKLYHEESAVPLNAIKKMKCNEFIKFFEKRIKDSGKYLKKKVSKLHSMSPDIGNADEEI